MILRKSQKRMKSAMFVVVDATAKAQDSTLGIFLSEVTNTGKCEIYVDYFQLLAIPQVAGHHLTLIGGPYKQNINSNS